MSVMNLFLPFYVRHKHQNVVIEQVGFAVENNTEHIVLSPYAARAGEATKFGPPNKILKTDCIEFYPLKTAVKVVRMGGVEDATIVTSPDAIGDFKRDQ